MKATEKPTETSKDEQKKGSSASANCACESCEQEEQCKQLHEEQLAQANDSTKQIEELTAKNSELSDKLLRQMAEFDNFRKRTQKERLEAYADATSRCVTEFLPALDNFERALRFDTDNAGGEFRKGIEMIFTQLQETLKKQGVEEIEAQGKPFDPELHNAVNQVENPDFGENTVCEVFQKGYRLGDKVIRHAMVVVANP